MIRKLFCSILVLSVVLVTASIVFAQEMGIITGKTKGTYYQFGLNLAQGHLQRPLPIPGAKNAEQALENAGAPGWRLTEEDVDRLDQASDSLHEE